VEAIILAGGKAERLGDAAGGRPKALVEVGGRPLAAYQVAQLQASAACRQLHGRPRACSGHLGGSGRDRAVDEPSRSAAAAGSACGRARRGPRRLR
jgi:hypothetical protein